ncbi:hypothetical protein ACOSQ3_002921 [Xanthoceras sorbifolium]
MATQLSPCSSSLKVQFNQESMPGSIFISILQMNVILALGYAGNVEPEGKEASFPFSESENVESRISITVVGASGDLAKKKIFPALFTLFYEEFFA